MRQRGFTLLEVILSMAMVAIIAASLFASLYTGYRARESATATMDPARAVHVALEMIGKDLECAMPPTGVVAGTFIGTRNIPGTGFADTLEFFRPAPLAIALDTDARVQSVQRIDLALITLTGDRLPSLVRGVTSNLLSPVTMEPEPEVLCRHVASFGLRYFDGALWQEAWDSTTLGNVVPAAVQVHIRVEWPVRRSTTPTIYEATRTFVLSCAQPPVTTDASTTGGSG